MQYVSLLIKPASSLCNMKCRYCFYADVSEHREESSKGIMSDETVDKLIDRSLEQFGGDTCITYAFQGGEPTCAGLPFFEKFVQKVEERKTTQTIQYALQTNGYLVDDTWASFFKKHDFLIGVSLDGYAENHDHFRICRDGSSSYSKVMKCIKTLRRHEVEHNILTVLTSRLSAHPDELYDFYKKNKMKYVQLIPCLPDLEHNDQEFALKPKEFFSFYDVFFNRWFEDYLKGEVMSVTLFDNLIPLFAGIPPQQCGYLGRCSRQCVIEGNGDVYPCDFYAVDGLKVGNICDSSMDELSRSPVYDVFLKQKRTKCKACEGCRYEGICHGQCKRLSVCYYDEEYCGYQEFIRKNERKLLYVAQNIRG